MKKIYINGYFTCEHINGVPRYAMELVKRLDEYFKPGEAEIVIPKGAKNIPKLNNIEICTWEDRGCKKERENVLWGDIDYKKYVMDKKGVSVNFTNRAEKITNSITTIHDLITLSSYEFAFKLPLKEKWKMSIHNIIDKIWFLHKVNVKKKYSNTIVTVSEFSRAEISKKLHIPLEKIMVIGNGWEHICEIKSVDEQRDLRIVKKKYFFSIGNMKPHKNFQWILKEAKILKNDIFVIAGKIPDDIADVIKSDLPNVVLLGYVSDSYMKFLMENAKGLIFPSLIEGFGIPPLEALAIGTPVIVSDIPVMHEIFGEAVGYFNPYKEYSNLDIIFEKACYSEKDNILRIHSWKNESKKWYDLISSQLI